MFEAFDGKGIACSTQNPPGVLKVDGENPNAWPRGRYEPSNVGRLLEKVSGFQKVNHVLDMLPQKMLREERRLNTLKGRTDIAEVCSGETRPRTPNPFLSQDEIRRDGPTQGRRVERLSPPS
jgi:hypothetical protein